MPPPPHHILASYHDVDIGFTRCLCGPFHHSWIHVARIPALVNIHHLGIFRCQTTHPVKHRDDILGTLLCRPVAHDVFVVGVDASHEYLAYALCIKRKQAAILEQDYALTGGFECRAAMLLAQSHLHRLNLVGIRVFKQPQPELHGKYAAHTLIDAFFAYHAVPHKLAHGINPPRAMHVHVHTGSDTLAISIFDSFGSAMQVMNMLNVHPVAHYKPVKSPLST